MQISKHMKKSVVSIHADATIRDAAQVFVKKHVGMLPVIDEEGRPIGVVGLADMLTLELPDFVSFVADVDFVHDFGAVERTRPAAAALAQSIRKLMKPPITVLEDCGLLRAYALMIQHKLHDIVVVSPQGQLVGIASRVDIGRAILKSWSGVEKK
ncbi:MAG TPA: CBS domain-containing protein [Anaerolineales bacterium]|nr:CBS domain-containing protein [Anaerolineales bacterium]